MIGLIVSSEKSRIGYDQVEITGIGFVFSTRLEFTLDGACYCLAARLIMITASVVAQRNPKPKFPIYNRNMDA